jgi:hypothetical protein
MHLFLQTIIEDGIKNNFLKQPLTQAELSQLVDLSYLQ